MEIEFRPGALVEQEVDTLIVPVGPGQELGDEAAAVNRRLDGALARLLADRDFKGAVGDTLVVPTFDRLPARQVVLTGVGAPERRGGGEIARAWSVAARAARDAGAQVVASGTPPAGQLSTAGSVRAATEGVILGLYRFLAYKTGPAPARTIETLVFAGGDAELKRGVALGEAVAAGVVLARDLGNQPPNALYPESLAAEAEALAEARGLGIQIYGPHELEEMGAGAILAVGKGSVHEPRLIHLTYTPQDSSRSAAQGSIALIGKSITFDSGGINLKPSGEGITRMKIDMAGGGAVLGAMSVVPSLGLPFTVHGVLAAAENMPSAGSFRPGDILTTMSGKTVEIGSTDAEGRLVLADALTYSIGQGAQALVDLATLTGSNVVALGEQGTGVYSNDQGLADEVLAAGRAVGELLWQMPLWEAYEGRLKGDFADLRNTSSRDGGAIFAALFIREFSQGVPWAHLDIAGPSWASRVTELSTVGATGHGVRSLVALLERRANGGAAGRA
ncbi:MAG TPA: leucyl aminopeptidase [Thermomicrobiaceae bacterium]|nr:leucyl aminopeptidase [Thermomicrobiaceae bacterium]